MYWTPPHLQPMIPINIDMVMEKNQLFLCEFVDLKRNGYHHYTKALNDVTYGFWGPWLKKSDEAITLFADELKRTIKLK